MMFNFKRASLILPTLLLLVACANVEQPESAAVSKPPVPVAEPALSPVPATVKTNSYTVEEGKSLSLIARDKYSDVRLWALIYWANQDSIKNPDLIYPAQKFDIPENVSSERKAEAIKYYRANRARR
ncbi:hypothetical protein RsTz2092_02740 [Deferribacterales bacterium RsTz2092]|nr:hypothetical protein AGMMS49941_06940 [Deferribacterales bacterium]